MTKIINVLKSLTPKPLLIDEPKLNWPITTRVAYMFFWVLSPKLNAFHQLNLKRGTTETILRTSAPRMMVIFRQGFRRISRCSPGVMTLCLSFFLWLYQFIMRRNDKNKPEVVEHDYFEGENSFVSICDKIVLI